MKFSRRQVLGSTLGMGAALSLPKAALAATSEPTTQMLALAKRELQRLGNAIPVTDRVGIADFSMPSWQPRFFILDMESGQAKSYRTTHGRGSDPAHSGWVKSFSNEPGSNASSRGAYVTAEHYSGKHGPSMRLDGLDADNSMARDRAIVVHGAWYANADMIGKYGKLGRSEGCFAFAERELPIIRDQLGPGRLLFAAKL